MKGLAIGRKLLTRFRWFAALMVLEQEPAPFHPIFERIIINECGYSEIEVWNPFETRLVRDETNKRRQ